MWPVCFYWGKKKRERKERVNDRGPQQGKGWWWWWWWGLTWKFVGCPIFDLSTFFTGFLRFDLAAGFDPLLFSFSFGTSDEPKPFPYLDSEGGFCFATFPPMAVMKVVWYRQQWRRRMGDVGNWIVPFSLRQTDRSPSWSTCGGDRIIKTQCSSSRWRKASPNLIAAADWRWQCKKKSLGKEDKGGIS